MMEDPLIDDNIAACKTGIRYSGKADSGQQTFLRVQNSYPLYRMERAFGQQQSV